MARYIILAPMEIIVDLLMVVMIIVLKLEYVQNETNNCLKMIYFVIQLVVYLNLIVYLILVKKRQKKDCLILMVMCYVKLLVLYSVFFMILDKECVVQLLHISHQIQLFQVSTAYPVTSAPDPMANDIVTKSKMV